nr:hypothetical protein [Tanacetum cinerariifolium]GEW85963.1 hypothetical protein [Tanacetum cinerariifolium]
MMILMLLIHLKSQSSSIRTSMKILHKVLHKLTTNVVTVVVIRKTVSSVSDVLVNLVGKIPIYYDDDDDEESSTPLRDIIISKLSSCIAITPVLSTKETKDSLIMRDEHLDTIPKKDSNEFIKSCVENLVPNPSESEDLSNIRRECDVPICDDFITFSNLFFDADDNFSSSDDESFSDEDIPKEIYSNPLFNEEIISIKIDPHHFNAESDLIESLLNQDSSIISSSKIDSILDEFVSELMFLKSIPPGIDEADCDPEEEIRLIEKLLYDNSSPRPSEEINFENSDTIIESFSPCPILFEDNDPLWRRSICFLLMMDQYPKVLIVTTQTPKGIIFFQKDCCTMILFPFRTFLTSQMSSEFFLPSLSIRNSQILKTRACGFVLRSPDLHIRIII